MSLIGRQIPSPWTTREVQELFIRVQHLAASGVWVAWGESAGNARLQAEAQPLARHALGSGLLSVCPFWGPGQSEVTLLTLRAGARRAVSTT